MTLRRRKGGRYPPWDILQQQQQPLRSLLCFLVKLKGWNLEGTKSEGNGVVLVFSGRCDTAVLNVHC